ncbi:hypothetical protein DL96DRAFT_1620953 [Flagelloscypha sp. PMI_526]|nr:hypothetical protein DL96DRAFT_1620953 [Flagelloscypha sp. PMI_526]
MVRVWILRLLSLAVGSLAATNFTVQDSDALITYNPPESWATAETCKRGDCLGPPSSASENQTTWHQGLLCMPYAFFIPLAIPTHTSLFLGEFIWQRDFVGGLQLQRYAAHLSFRIDDEPARHFNFPSSGDGFKFNALLFSAENLRDESHTLTIENPGDRSTGGDGSLILLDYFVYTKNEPSDNSTGSTSPSPSPVSGVSAHASNNAGAIAGGVVGGLVFLFAIAFVVFAWYRRKHAKPLLPSPFYNPSTSDDKTRGMMNMKSTPSPSETPRSKTLDLNLNLNPTSWLSRAGSSRSHNTPLGFNPEMMVARSSSPAASPVPRIIDLTSGEPQHPPPSSSPRHHPVPINPTESRILAWQRQTAEATADDGGGGGSGRGVVSTSAAAEMREREQRRKSATGTTLTNYWDQTTESYRSWEAKTTFPPSSYPAPREKSPVPRPLPVLPVASSPHAPTAPASLHSQPSHPVGPASSPGALPPPPPIPDNASTPHSPRRVTRRLTVMNN